MENKRRTLPVYGPWDLEQFRARLLIYGPGGGGGGPQFPGLGMPRRKDMKHVNGKKYVENMNKYVGSMREYLQNMKEYVENMKKWALIGNPRVHPSLPLPIVDGTVRK